MHNARRTREARDLECPRCRGHAINFWRWCLGFNAFRYTCESCGTGLQASVAVWVGFVITIVVALPGCVLAGAGVARLMFAESCAWSRISVGVLLTLVVALAGTIVTYSLCGYKFQRE